MLSQNNECCDAILGICLHVISNDSKMATFIGGPSRVWTVRLWTVAGAATGET